VNIDDLMEMKLKEYSNSTSRDVVYSYLRIAEHNIFLGKFNKAKTLLKKLGFNKSIINEYILSVSKKYDDDDDELMKKVFLGKIDKKKLN
jgi:hypothetical protein|tara:strand:- start:277 stop:546 length:270 start_codon:yes stop_codon:yes gene_type:complete